MLCRRGAAPAGGRRIVIDASPVARLGDAIANTALGVALRESTRVYPRVETIHIVGFALLVGSIFVVDLRLLGMQRDVALAPLLRFVLPVTLLCLLLVVPSGLLLFAAHASDLVGNRAFIVKLVLLFAAATNALMFHVGPLRAQLGAEVDEAPGTRPRGPTRIFAALSLALWISILVAGRMIAYV